MVHPLFTIVIMKIIIFKQSKLMEIINIQENIIFIPHFVFFKLLFLLLKNL